MADSQRNLSAFSCWRKTIRNMCRKTPRTETSNALQAVILCKKLSVSKEHLRSLWRRVVSKDTILSCVVLEASHQQPSVVLQGSRETLKVDIVSLATDDGVVNNGGGDGGREDEEMYRMRISRIQGW